MSLSQFEYVGIIDSKYDSNIIENKKFEPEINYTTENLDNNDDDNITVDIDEYSTKCGEIYKNDRTKKFHLFCFYCRREYKNFGLLLEHVSEIHFPFNYKRNTNRSILGLELCGQIFISDMCRFIHICIKCKKPYEEYKKLLQHYLDAHTNDNCFSAIKEVTLENGNLLQYQMMPNDILPTKKRKYISYNKADDKIDINKSLIFKCKDCKRDFAADDDRKNHVCERPWPCEICGKAFKTNWNLIEHIRVHTGEKPFRCDKCNKSFTKSGNLNVHRLTHTEIIPIKCDFCWSIFSQKSTLKSHIRRQHSNVEHVQKRRR